MPWAEPVRYNEIGFVLIKADEEQVLLTKPTQAEITSELLKYVSEDSEILYDALAFVRNRDRDVNGFMFDIELMQKEEARRAALAFDMRP